MQSSRLKNNEYVSTNIPCEFEEGYSNCYDYGIINMLANKRERLLRLFRGTAKSGIQNSLEAYGATFNNILKLDIKERKRLQSGLHNFDEKLEKMEDKKGKDRAFKHLVYASIKILYDGGDIFLEKPVNIEQVKQSEIRVIIVE